MTQEEKAKAYDEAKARMSRAWNDNRCTLGFMNEIFPEPKESEDERIRKALIKFHKSTIDIDGIKGGDILAWLEKQAEQKPVISNNALREGIAHFGITQYQIDNWLKKYVDVEKQGEHKKFRDSIQIGDRVTRNEDGVLVNLSQLDRVSKQGKNMGISEATKQELKDNLNKALEKETPESWSEFLDEGEQNLVDKIEPKFHEGEWITIKE